MLTPLISSGRQLVLICGISGAGKTTAVRALPDPPIKAVSLDRVLKRVGIAHGIWNVNPEKEHGNFSSAWTEYLRTLDSHFDVVRSFREQILQDVTNEHRIVVVEGASLANADIERLVIDAIVSTSDFDLGTKFYLRVKPETAYEQRALRAKSNKEKTYQSLEEANRLSKRLDRILPPREYVAKNALEIHKALLQPQIQRKAKKIINAIF